MHETDSIHLVLIPMSAYIHQGERSEYASGTRSVTMTSGRCIIFNPHTGILIGGASLRRSEPGPSTPFRFRVSAGHAGRPAPQRCRLWWRPRGVRPDRTASPSGGTLSPPPSITTELIRQSARPFILAQTRTRSKGVDDSAGPTRSLRPGRSPSLSHRDLDGSYVGLRTVTVELEWPHVTPALWLSGCGHGSVC